MPGLFGLVRLRPNRPLDPGATESLLSEMADRLAHTSRQRTETWTDLANGFAIGRSACAHPAPTPWPRPAAAGSPVVFVDGAIHADSTQPAEVAREPLFRAEARLGELRGFFVAALFSTSPRRVVLTVDRHASHPIAFAVVDDTLYFAPEAKALLAVAGLPRRPNAAALGLFFGGGYVFPNETLFTDVERLRGGERLVVDRDTVRREAYWLYRVTPAGDGTPPEELERELAVLVKAAVARNHAAGASIVLLSGGADSRAIAASAHELASEASPVRTVSWTYGDGAPDSDAPISRQLVAEFGFRHTWLERDTGNFARDFTRLGYILEGLSDTPAYHPYEMELVDHMARQGATRVLRGDESFGWGEPVADARSALSELGLRRPEGLGRLRLLLQPASHRTWCEAAGARLDRVSSAWEGGDPDTLRDQLYFEIRLQGLLNSIAYAKSLVADHRNPLLDESILDFNARVSAELRRGKRLFRRACARAFPRFWRLPFANRQNLVDWAAELSRPSAVRRFLHAELEDDDSAVWEHFQPGAVRAWFDQLRPARRSGGRRRMRGVLREAVRRVPALEARIRSRYQSRVLRAEDFLLRFLVLKSWFDLQGDGDGSRRRFEIRLERAVAIDAGAPGAGERGS